MTLMRCVNSQQKKMRNGIFVFHYPKRDQFFVLPDYRNVSISIDDRSHNALGCPTPGQSLLDFNTASPELMSAIAYPALVADPPAVAAAACAELELPDDHEFASKVETFLEAQRSGARASPPAALPEPGLTHDEVLQRPTVAAFCARFGVEPERIRLTGVHP